MDLFTPFWQKQMPQPGGHSGRPSRRSTSPAFQIGQRAGRWFDGQFERAGNYLNAWQHRIGFRRRNLFVLGILLSLLTYFVYDLLTLL